MSRRGVLVIAVMALSLAFTPLVFAQTDPGVRGTPAGAGPALASVLANDPPNILKFFNTVKGTFEEVDEVADGLGPRFNSRSCVACHSQPATGGSSPAVNPQVADATFRGANNVVPSFISATGPVREARFIFFTNNGVPDQNRPNGGVEDLFTIAGRDDDGTCNVLAQPGFANAVATNNVIFRIPTPTFGTGLMENIDETTLLVNLANQAGNSFGVSGTFNRNGNDGTITRFGWKAQNKSLEIFSGEAYNVEMGVSNEMFPQERPLPGEGGGNAGQTGLPASCKLNPTPEDTTHFDGEGAEVNNDAVQFALFMRLLAPPTPSATVPGGSASIGRGRALFTAIGCATCHTPSLTTERSKFTKSLSQATANLFSDIEIHHMGVTLADNVSQGNAGGDQFRTAPLWGLGQRIFFLHDGRTTLLYSVNNNNNAIRAHNASGSEANAASFNFIVNLNAAQKQDVLNFLRSL
jgi:CxxC motif-containing protein (DUF1111 family)